MSTCSKIVRDKSSGFTLIEALLVMGIIAVLTTISSLLLTGLIPKASLTSASEQLIAETRQHQFKAMIGETIGVGSQPQNKGLKIETHRYIFFEGNTYDPNSLTNIYINIEDPLSVETTFVDQVVVFEKGSGQILNYNPNQAVITITNSSNNEVVELEFNKYGVITAINN